MPTTFEVLSPDGSPIFVACLPNERGTGKPWHEYVHDDTQLEKFIATYDKPGFALYHTVAILRNGAWRKQENVRATLYVWGDLDFKDHPDIPREEIARRLDAIPLRPTFFVNSGHGIHCYWLLKEEEDASPGNGQRRIEEVLQLICNYIGGDPQAAETARLLRLPGSHNTRNAGESLLVTLEDVDLSRRYDLSELADFLLEAHPILPQRKKADDEPALDLTEVPPGPVDVEMRLATMKYKGKGWTSIHATQLSVTAALTADNRPIEETVERVLAETRRVAERDDPGQKWNWDAERHDITQLCTDLVNKKFKEEGVDLSHTLPEPLYQKWQKDIEAGRRPVVSGNGAGLHVRGFASTVATDGNVLRLPEGEAKPRRIRLLPYDAPDRATIPRRDWLYGYHYMRRIVSATIGPGGIGKSSLGLVEAVSMSLGRDLLGEEKLARPLRVWYHNGEDPREEINRRIAAVCIKYELEEQEVRKNLFITCGLDMPIKVARGATEVRLDKTLVAEISEVIQEEKIDVAIFDPLVTLHSTSELLSATMDPVIREVFAAIANDTNAAIELAHHTRKKATGQDEYTAADARGTSGIVDAVRAVRVTNPMSKAEAEGYGIDELERESYLRLTKGKVNMTRRGPSRWFRFDNVTLPNGDPEKDIPGDDVGVLLPWTAPCLEVPITAADRKWVRELVTANTFLREDQRAKDWIGKPIGLHFQLDPAHRVERFQIQQIVKKLLDDGVLRRVERIDGTGHKRTYLAVAKGSDANRRQSENTTDDD